MSVQLIHIYRNMMIHAHGLNKRIPLAFDGIQSSESNQIQSFLFDKVKLDLNLAYKRLNSSISICLLHFSIHFTVISFDSIRFDSINISLSLQSPMENILPLPTIALHSTAFVFPSISGIEMNVRCQWCCL